MLSIRARVFPYTHTLFDFKKIKVSRAKILKKLSLLGASRHPCHLYLIVVPAAETSLSFPTEPALGNSRNRRERGRLRSRPAGRAVVTSSQVGTHVRRCPRLGLLLRDLRAVGFLLSSDTCNTIVRNVCVLETKTTFSLWGGLAFNAFSLSTGRFDSGRRGTREQRRFGWWSPSSATLRARKRFYSSFFGDYFFFFFLTELWSAF